jgi:hypothetical protein
MIPVEVSVASRSSVRFTQLRGLAPPMGKPPECSLLLMPPEIQLRYFEKKSGDWGR